MAIPDKIIDQVQERTDIVEVISRYVPLKKAGRNYKAPCPFHHEKTPSFVVSPDKQIYHCFGCNAGGNVFSFLMKHENLQFPEVIEMLAEKAGVVLPRDIASKEANSFAVQLYKINDLACQLFQTNLANNKAAREYLAARGLGEAAIKKFRIGYAPDAWEALINFFKAKGVTAAVLEKAGLVVANERGGHYDRFRNRITFPIVDLKDRILGFGARVLDAGLPKYINSPETIIYSKGRNLYGLNVSKEAIKKEKYALVVEGYLDFLVPYQAGIQNVIATLGTALTVDQVKLVKRFANTVIIVYDPDAAGESASLRGLDLFIGEDVNVYIAELTSGLDPDSHIRKFGADDFLRIVKAGKNLFDYKFDKLAKRFDARTTHGKAGIVTEMLPTIARIQNAVAKSELTKKLAQKLSVDEDAIKTELRKVKGDYAERAFVLTPVEVKREAGKAELVLLALLLSGEDFVGRITRAIGVEEFKNSTVRDIVGLIFSMHKENKEINAARLVSHLGTNTEAAALITEAASMLDMMADKDKAMDDCIARIRKDNVKDQLARIQDAIKAAHSQNDEAKVKHLVTEYNSLVRQHKA